MARGSLALQIQNSLCRLHTSWKRGGEAVRKDHPLESLEKRRAKEQAGSGSRLKAKKAFCLLKNLSYLELE